MPEQNSQLQQASASDSEALAAYQRWKLSRGVIPWRLPFGGLFLLGIMFVLSIEHVWSTPYWAALVASGLFFLLGAISLFYDIPRKRLSRFSRLVLIIGMAGPFVLVMLAMLCKPRAGDPDQRCHALRLCHQVVWGRAEAPRTRLICTGGATRTSVTAWTSLSSASAFTTWKDPTLSPRRSNYTGSSSRSSATSTAVDN